MVMASAENSERVLYARWDIGVCRGIERFSDYKKAKARIRRQLDTRANASAPQDQKRHWCFLLSEKGLATITAAGTIALVLLGMATLIVGVVTLIVMLLLHA
jgi:hypothetical protein